ncbi:hypothetical protein J6590_049097 [Homalodisca vitripennis]|nr:hypothetical protein J6590_049097 [Homalodisca vitripennis]
MQCSILYSRLPLRRSYACESAYTVKVPVRWLTFTRTITYIVQQQYTTTPFWNICSTINVARLRPFSAFVRRFDLLLQPHSSIDNGIRKCNLKFC